MRGGRRASGKVSPKKDRPGRREVTTARAAAKPAAEAGDIISAESLDEMMTAYERHARRRVFKPIELAEKLADAYAKSNNLDPVRVLREFLPKLLRADIVRLKYNRDIVRAPRRSGWEKDLYGVTREDEDDD